MLLLALAACGSEDADASPSEQPTTPVRTVEAAVSEQADTIRTSGILASLAEMDLAFPVPGYVAELLVGEGDRVRAGQVLARLRTEEVDAGVRSAEAQAEAAAKNLGRMQRLFADSVITGAALEQAQQAHEQAQAALTAARYKQNFATIKAPADGRVLRRRVEVSEFVPAGTPVLRVAATGSGWIVRAPLSDRHVGRISTGDPAEVTLAALDPVSLPGRVSRIADAADPRTGTFEVEIALEGDHQGLRSGMVARVQLTPASPERVVVVPTHALVDTDGSRAAVFVVEGDRVRRQPVRVVRIGNESVRLDPTSLEGAVIVTDGAAYLRDGERIEDRTVEMGASRK